MTVMSHRVSDLLVIASLSGAIVTWQDHVEFGARMAVAALACIASILAIYRHVRAIRRERSGRK